MLDDLVLVDACRRHYGAACERELVLFGAVMVKCLADDDRAMKRYGALIKTERKIVAFIELSCDVEIYYTLIIKIIGELLDSVCEKTYLQIVNRYFEFVRNLERLVV